ncbi:ribonuclease kappa-B [Ixodes scapularis]|eukprot:XP_002410921.1 salivary secreted ribonuclease, putative [Ixodes scapularis]
MRICGPKLSVCCSILSVWGIIMLVILGIFLFTHSVAFAEDLAIDEKLPKIEFLTEINRKYTQAAYNCWIAACLYVVTLAVSVHQIYMNRRCNYSV